MRSKDRDAVVDAYRMSFTAVSLALRESWSVAQLALTGQDWESIRQQVLDNNLLQARTQRSAKRTYQEIGPRLQQLSQDQLELLVNGNLQEQKCLLWFAICKTYAFVRDFSIEVIHEKFAALNYAVTKSDYQAFFNRKADWHEELDDLSETTRCKVQTTLFRMLREAGILSEAHVIIPTILSTRLIETLAPDAPMSFLIFPTHIQQTRG